MFLQRFQPSLNWARAQVTIMITAIILSSLAESKSIVDLKFKCDKVF